MFFLALTPAERWQAARRFNPSAVAEYWFVIAAGAALAVLIALFLWVSYNRMVEKRRIADHFFSESVKRRGLTPRERHLLLEITRRTGLKHRNAIFTAQDAFDRGMAILIEERLASQQPPEETDQLRAELSVLDEKLGFQPERSTGSPGNTRKLSSRQIPIGKSIHVTRRKTRRTTGIEAIVLRNTDKELVVRLAMPVQSKVGDYWSVHYYSGASVSEFDTSAIRCAGDILVLNHSDDVRLTSRRRIRRVPVNRPALIAHFPVVRVIPQKINRNKTISKAKRASAKERSWTAPEFVPGIVTEQAGPGLRIEAPLQVKVGDRLLVIFELDEQDGQAAASKKNREKPPSKIVQDVGIVKHTKATKNRLSISLELVGFGEAKFDELIGAVHTVSPQRGPAAQDHLALSGSEKAAKEPVVESVAVQGV